MSLRFTKYVVIQIYCVLRHLVAKSYTIGKDDMFSLVLQQSFKLVSMKPLWYHSDTAQIPLRHRSDTAKTLLRHRLDTAQTPLWHCSMKRLQHSYDTTQWNRSDTAQVKLLWHRSSETWLKPLNETATTRLWYHSVKPVSIDLALTLL